jgi:hypothetical protein
MDEIKICRECGEEKSLNDFPNDSRNKDGRRNICRDCDNEKRRNKKTPHKVDIIAKKIPKSHSLRPILLEMSEIIEKYATIQKSLDNPVLSDIDMTQKIILLSAEMTEKMSQFKEEYNNIIYPPKDEFCIHKSDFVAPYSTTSSGDLILMIQSKLQLFIILNKSMHSNVSVSLNSGVYSIKIDNIKLKNEEITNFLVSNRLVLSTYNYIN